MQLILKEIEYILEPIFKSAVRLLELGIPESSKELTDKHISKAIKEYESKVRKIFRVVPDLIGMRGLVEECGKVMDVEEHQIRTFLAKGINFFENKGLLLRVETPEIQLQLSPEYKLLITPLGICFLYCYHRGLLDLSKNFDDNILHVNRFLGHVYNELVKARINETLSGQRAPLNKQQVAISLLLLLSQSVTRDKAFRIMKDAFERESLLTNLTKALNKIGEEVFNKRDLFPAERVTDYAIRRSGDAADLRGKMVDRYVKESVKEEDNLYFRGAKEDELSFIVTRVAESIKQEEERDGASYSGNVIKLIEGHIKDRGFLFPPYIRMKFIAHEIRTDYLQRLAGLFRKKLR